MEKLYTIKVVNSNYDTIVYSNPVKASELSSTICKIMEAIADKVEITQLAAIGSFPPRFRFKCHGDTYRLICTPLHDVESFADEFATYIGTVWDIEDIW